MGQFWMIGEEKQDMVQHLSNLMILQTAKIELSHLFQHQFKTSLELKVNITQFWMNGQDKQAMVQHPSNLMILLKAKIEFLRLFQHLDHTFIELKESITPS